MVGDGWGVGIREETIWAWIGVGETCGLIFVMDWITKGELTMEGVFIGNGSSMVGLEGGTFTKIKAIGIITNVLFFMFSCQKLY